MQQNIPIVERRIAARVVVARDVSVTSDAGVFSGRTVNVSVSGVLVALAGDLPIWAEVAIALPGIGVHGARVARHDGRHYGLVFREPLSAAAFADFTGTEVPPEVPVAPPVRAKPVARTAPWAFGRDRLKTLKREAAERAWVPER